MTSKEKLLLRTPKQGDTQTEANDLLGLAGAGHPMVTLLKWFETGVSLSLSHKSRDFSVRSTIFPVKLH